MKRNLIAALLALALAGTNAFAAQSRGAGGKTRRARGHIATFIGPVSSSDAFVAITINEEKSQAYVCDGTGDRVTISQWFEGELPGGARSSLPTGNGVTARSFVAKADSTSIDLTNEAGWRLKADLSGGSAVGSIALAGGHTMSFTAKAAGGVADLYQVQGTSGADRYRAAWIVLSDRRIRGAFKIGGTLAVAPPLDLGTLIANLPGIGPSSVTRTHSEVKGEEQK